MARPKDLYSIFKLRLLIFIFFQFGYHEMSDLLDHSYRIVSLLRQIFAFTLCKSIYKRQDSDNL